MKLDFSQSKFLSVVFYNVTYNVNIEFLKIATLETMLSVE